MRSTPLKFKGNSSSVSGVCLFLVCLGCIGGAGCERNKAQDPEKILREMIRVSSDASFTGIKSFEQNVGDQFFRFRLKISHRAPDMTRLEFLEPAAKKGRIIIKRGRQSWKMGSVEEEPMHYKQFGSHRDMEIRNLELLLQNYRLHYMGMESIARHRADIIQILSRWPPAIERRLWVDRVNRLPLKSEEIDTTGAGPFRKRFLYEQIDFVQNLPDDLFDVPIASGSRSIMPRGGKESICLAEAKHIAPFTIILPRRIPRGFILEQIRWIERPATVPSAGARQSGGGERTPSGFLHFHYSDGLRAVSLFEENSGSFRSPAVPAAENASEADDRIDRMSEGTTTILHRRKDGTHATLVGEIEAEELLRMISSLDVSED